MAGQKAKKLERLTRAKVITLAKEKRDVSGYDLSLVNLSKLDLIAVQFNDCNLKDAMLHGTDLSGANLSSADMREATLVKPILVAANLNNTDLRGARMNSVDMQRARLEGTKMDDRGRGFIIHGR